MEKEEKKSGVLPQIIVAVVVALIAGSTSPWWWNELFSKPKPRTPISSPPPSLAPNPTPAVKKYLMDNRPDRIIILTHLRNNEYRIEEPSSSWPWQGTALLDGGQLSGEAKFRNSLATMRVEGVVRGDGSIVIQYKFIKDDSGRQYGGIDNHVWFPNK